MVRPKFFLIVCVPSIICFVAILVLYSTGDIGKGYQHKPSFITHHHLFKLSEGIKFYVEREKEWPEDLSIVPLKHRMYKEIITPFLKDGWGNPIFYQPSVTNFNYGLLISWGKDGQPDGSDDSVMRIEIGEN